MITTDLIFDRRHTAKGKSLGTVEIKVTVNRRSQYMSTGVRLLKSEWKFGQIVNRPDAHALMTRLSALKNRVETEIASCIENGTEINLQRLRDNVTPNKEQESMYDWMLMCESNMNVGKATHSRYLNTIEKLKVWGGIRSWGECTPENVQAFDKWLHTLKKPHSNETISDSGLYNYHKCFKSLLHQAFNANKIKSNPYDKLKGKFKRGDKENVEYLIQDEMQRIEALEGLGRIYDEARDLFVVQMYTGLSYTDLMAFDISEYKQVGKKYIRRAERIKTGVPYVSQLLPPVLKVLAKYDNTLPHINNAEYNERLKVIGRLAEIDIPLHSHLARHTFATWMLSNGVPIEHVSKMLGHTNITQTQRYAKVLAQDVRGSFEMVERKLRGKASQSATKG